MNKEKELVLMGFLYSYALSTVENNADKKLVKLAKEVCKHFKKRKPDKSVNILSQEETHQKIQKFHNEYLKDKATAKEFIFLGVFDYLLNVANNTELKVKFGHLDLLSILDNIERNNDYREPMRIVFKWLIEVERI